MRYISFIAKFFVLLLVVVAPCATPLQGDSLTEEVLLRMIDEHGEEAVLAGIPMMEDGIDVDMSTLAAILQLQARGVPAPIIKALKERQEEQTRQEREVRGVTNNGPFQTPASGSVDDNEIGCPAVPGIEVYYQTTDGWQPLRRNQNAEQNAPTSLFGAASLTLRTGEEFKYQGRNALIQLDSNPVFCVRSGFSGAQLSVNDIKLYELEVRPEDNLRVLDLKEFGGKRVLQRIGIRKQKVDSSIMLESERVGETVLKVKPAETLEPGEYVIRVTNVVVGPPLYDFGIPAKDAYAKN